MALTANIFALMMLIVAPLVQPCFCSDFTLFCKCEIRAADCGTGCCNAGHSTDDEAPQPLPKKDKPCDAPLAPELANSVIAAESTAAFPAALVAALPHSFNKSCLDSRAAPLIWSKPPPICLIVVRTSFLRI